MAQGTFTPATKSDLFGHGGTHQPLAERLRPHTLAEVVGQQQVLGEGMPLRLAVCGTSKTPSIDAVLALLGRAEVLKRLSEI